MDRQTATLALSLSLALAGSALASEEEQGWSGEGQFGYVAARGNTETETLKIGANGTYNLEKWRYSAFFNALFSSENEVDTAERYELGGKADYKLDDISYWFGSLRYEDDQFSQFDFQATLAVGYGRELISTDEHLLKGELGVGYRAAEIRATGESENDPIVRGALDYKWTISDTASLTNKTLIESGSDNTFGSNITQLNTTIRDGLGLALGYEVRHNTDVDEPTNNSDFLTTVNLVYSFK